MQAANKNSWGADLKEVLIVLKLAIQDGIRPQLLGTSLVIGVGAVLLWAIIFGVFWTPIYQGVATVAGWILMALLLALFVAAGMAHTGGQLGDFLQQVHVVFTWSLLIVLFLLLVIVTVRIALELILMSRIQKQCLKRYDNLPQNVQNAWHGGLVDTIKTMSAFVFGTVIGLFIPLIGGLLVLALGAYLNIRSLINDALEGVATDEERKALIKSNRRKMLLLGLLFTPMMLIPLAGLFVPVFMGASVVHLMVRAHQKTWPPIHSEVAQGKIESM